MWWLRLRSPGKTKVHSLKTPDKATAEVIALPMIAEHKAALLAARPHFETAWRHDYVPGREHIGPDGARIIATERELLHMDAAGAIIRTEPNGAYGLWPVAHKGEAATATMNCLKPT